MRISIVGAGAVDQHPPSRTLHGSLLRAGNQVDVVARAPGRPRLRQRLRSVTDLVVPATRGDIAIAATWARDLGAHLTGPPAWGLPGELDIAWAAPGSARLSAAPAGPGLPRHLAPATERAATPTGTHRGRSVAVVCRWTPQSPGRYLADALEIAEVTVHRADALDWDAFPAVDAVLVIESPLPAFAVRGAPRSVPVLFWAHHGEHHTLMHLRLVARYGADAVLLAHSWHLAHRFPVPVHRFPFGTPTDLLDASAPWDERALDAAFVGSGTMGGGAYGRRGAILDAVRAEVPMHRRAIEEGATPERMAALYSTARVVPNDCGTRHRPVTMRVLEAVGSGALLLTEDAPGLDRLLAPGEHHAVLQDDVAPQLRAILRDPTSSSRAGAATAHALAHHTVRHRVDDLLEIIAMTPPRTGAAPAPPSTSPALLVPVVEDLLLDDVLLLALDVEVDGLPDRIVWPAERLTRLVDRPLAHAVVVGDGWIGDADAVARAARRLVVCPANRTDIIAAVAARHPAASDRPAPRGVAAIDLGTPGYRILGDHR